jgi:glyoxylase-like metal-dependent hydrolase (beta-lactamase superfamily II)
MRIHHLNCGTFCPVGERFINGRGGIFHSGTLVCHCLLIELPHGLALVDTGLGLTDVHDPQHSLPGTLWRALNRPQLRENETAVHQIKALGFHASDVRHIVLTHLDFDHAGGLPDFPHATVHVYGPEYEEAFSCRNARSRMRYAPRQFQGHDLWQVYDNAHGGGEKWYGFNAVRHLQGLPPDILLIPLVGHSRGHCGVAIETGGGHWLLNCGDAAFWHGELETPQRHCPLGLRAYQNIFQYNRGSRMANQERLRELMQSAGARGMIQAFCSHDPEMMQHFAGREVHAA